MMATTISNSMSVKPLGVGAWRDVEAIMAGSPLAAWVESAARGVKIGMKYLASELIPALFEIENNSHSQLCQSLKRRFFADIFYSNFVSVRHR